MNLNQIWNPVIPQYFTFLDTQYNNDVHSRGEGDAQSGRRPRASRASHLYVYESELPFLLVLSLFALHMYFYLRPTTMMKELRNYFNKSLWRVNDNF
jgi:hypothetical protein